VCERLFGSHPAQVCFEWNTAEHTSDYEGRPHRRSLTKAELQGLFDHLDDQVASLRARGNKAWLAMRHASLAGADFLAYAAARTSIPSREWPD
jgi:hypothetical protein